MWGHVEPCQTIIINGKPFVGRRNLFDFFHNVRTMVTPTNRTWSDAICIDQTCHLTRCIQAQHNSMAGKTKKCFPRVTVRLPETSTELLKKERETGSTYVRNLATAPSDDLISHMEKPRF
jgi:hypothetical protein